MLLLLLLVPPPLGLILVPLLVLLPLALPVVFLSPCLAWPSRTSPLPRSILSSLLALASPAILLGILLTVLPVSEPYLRINVARFRFVLLQMVLHSCHSTIERRYLVGT